MNLLNQKGLTSFVVLTILLVLIIGAGLFFYKSSPAKRSCNTDGYIWNVDSKQAPGLSAADLDQMKKAFYKEACDNPVNLQNGQKISYEGIKASGDWAISGGVTRNKEDKIVPGEGSLVIFHKVNGVWLAAMPSSKQYADWLDKLPEDLISKDSKQLLK